MITRFARFNIVGVVGFGVQVTLLTLLVGAGLPVAAATLVAVEAALLHNFVWHERWTWADMAAQPFRTANRRVAASRLARFHLTNGLVSLGGNVLLTPVLAEAGVPLALASLASVTACAAVNFATAHLLVFCAKTWPTFHGHLH